MKAFKTRPTKIFPHICLHFAYGRPAALGAAITDDAGRKLKFAVPPTQVVCLVPAVSEIAGRPGEKIEKVIRGQDLPEILGAAFNALGTGLKHRQTETGQ